MPDPTTFTFMFPDGVKSRDEMTREELYQVIDYLASDRKARKSNHVQAMDFMRLCVGGAARA